MVTVMLRGLGVLAAALAFGMVGAVMAPDVAHADSCWDHNGSTMRLKASGNQRTIMYEKPRRALRASGVRRGTVLFTGVRRGNQYIGQARVFSRHCVGSPLIYDVSGWVSNNDTRVTLEGEREVHRRCVGTGSYTYDTLVFDFEYQC